MTSLLQTCGLSVSFGAVRAVDGVDLEVQEGTLVGLIGPNGAGKTTLVDALTGFVRSQGSILFDGREIQRLPAHRRTRLGLGRTWQSLELFEGLTVRENLVVASQRQGARSFLLDVVRGPRKVVDAVVEESLDLVGIGDLAGRFPSEISQGQRKLVSVARALAARPRLVCMDEPAAGLDSQESRQLGLQLRRLVGTGVAVLLIDHDMDLVLDVCSRVHVLEFGRIIAHGTPAEVRADRAVIEAYLGSIDDTEPRHG